MTLRVNASSTKRSESARKGWETRRKRAALKKHAQLCSQEGDEENYVSNVATRDRSSRIDMPSACIKDGDATPLISLIKEGKDIKGSLRNIDENDLNAPNTVGVTPLIFAVIMRNHDAVHALLQYPSLNVNAVDSNGTTAIEWAVHNSDLSVLEMLLKRPDIDLDSALVFAASRGDSEVVFAFLYEHADKIRNINVWDRNGETALIAAIKCESETVIDMLLKHPSIDVNCLSKYGDSPLIQAVRSRNIAIVKWLLKFPDLDVCQNDSEGLSPFIWSLHCCCLDVAELLAEKTSAKHFHASACLFGDTALTIAIISLLMEQYVVVQKLDTKSFEDQLFSWKFLLCDKIYNKYIVHHLLWRDDLRVNVFDCDGHSALTWSLSKDLSRVVRLLISRKDVDVNLAGPNGLSPLCDACQRGNCRYVDLLLQRADLDVNYSSLDRNSALEIAASNKNMPIVDMLLMRKDIVVIDVLEKSIANNDIEIVLKLAQFRRDNFNLLLLLDKYLRSKSVSKDMSRVVQSLYDEVRNLQDEKKETKSSALLVLVIFSFIGVNILLNIVYEALFTE